MPSLLGLALLVGLGQPVPAFETTALQGETLAYPALLTGQRAAVVVFLSTACPYARYFAPHLVALHDAYESRGVAFVAVYSNGWESRDEVAADARKQGFAFPVVKDEGHKVASLLGAERTPEAYLIDANGTLRYRGWVESRKESPDLKRAIDALLAGRAVPMAETKAFGCAIDR